MFVVILAPKTVAVIWSVECEVGSVQLKMIDVECLVCSVKCAVCSDLVQYEVCCKQLVVCSVVCMTESLPPFSLQGSWQQDKSSCWPGKPLQQQLGSQVYYNFVKWDHIQKKSSIFYLLRADYVERVTPLVQTWDMGNKTVSVIAHSFLLP